MCYIRKIFFGLNNFVFNHGIQGLMRRPSIKCKARTDYNFLTLFACALMILDYFVFYVWAYFLRVKLAQRMWFLAVYRTPVCLCEMC